MSEPNTSSQPEGLGPRAEFDVFAEQYSQHLPWVSLTGETVDYFAGARVKCLAKLLESMSAPSRSVMDFGCGVGIATPHLLRTLCAQQLVGLDVSQVSLASAQKQYGEDPRVLFVKNDCFKPSENLDLVYCNGVFHHIHPEDRPKALRLILDSLKPGGIFALWENNTWNPGMALAMRFTDLDRDAMPLSCLRTRKMVQAAGFELLRCDFLFIFPRLLAFLRRIEPFLSRLPIGAQYQLLCRKPPFPK